MLSVIIPIADHTEVENLLKWLQVAELDFVQILIIHDGDDLNLRNTLVSALRNKDSNWNQLLISDGRNPGTSRNIGLAKALGEWIHFCDADDFLYLSEILNAIHSNEIATDVIIGQYRKLDANSRRIIFESSTTSLANFILEVGIWRCVFNAKSIINCEFIESRMGEDQIFILTTHVARMNVAFTQLVFYDYFVSGSNQLTGNKSNISDLEISIKAGLTLETSDLIEEKFKFEILSRMLITFTIKESSLSNKQKAFLTHQVWQNSRRLTVGQKLHVFARLILLAAYNKFGLNRKLPDILESQNAREQL